MIILGIAVERTDWHYQADPIESHAQIWNALWEDNLTG